MERDPVMPETPDSLRLGDLLDGHKSFTAFAARRAYEYMAKTIREDVKDDALVRDIERVFSLQNLYLPVAHDAFMIFVNRVTAAERARCITALLVAATPDEALKLVRDGTEMVLEPKLCAATIALQAKANERARCIRIVQALGENEEIVKRLI